MATIEHVQTPWAQSLTQSLAQSFPIASALPPSQPAPARDAALNTKMFYVSAGHAVAADTLTDAVIEAQMRQVWSDLFAAMKAGGFEKGNLQTAVMYVTMGGKCRLFRRVRDEMLERLPIPSSCIQMETLEHDTGCIAIEAKATR